MKFILPNIAITVSTKKLHHRPLTVLNKLTIVHFKTMAICFLHENKSYLINLVFIFQSLGISCCKRQKVYITVATVATLSCCYRRFQRCRLQECVVL